MNPDVEKIVRITTITGVLATFSPTLAEALDHIATRPAIVRPVVNHQSTFTSNLLAVTNLQPDAYGNYYYRTSVNIWTPGKDEIPHPLLGDIAHRGDYLYSGIHLYQRGEPVDHLLKEVRIKRRIRADGSVIFQSEVKGQKYEGNDLSGEYKHPINFPHAGVYYYFPFFPYTYIKDGTGQLSFDWELQNASNDDSIFSGTIGIRILPLYDRRLYLPSVKEDKDMPYTRKR